MPCLMETTLKKTVLKSLLAMSAALLVSTASAADFPDYPMTWVVPYSAGGTTDLMARHLASEMGKVLKQTIVVTNQPGSASITGATTVARSAPDGYVFGTVDSGTLAFNPALYSSLPYDAKKDFSFIGGLGKMPLLLVVSPSFPARNFNELMSLVRKKPGTITFASSGNGSPLHVALELFKQKEGVSLGHMPYKGSAPALQGLMSGQVDSMFVDLPPSLQLIQEGKLRVLAVATLKRLTVLPSAPTLDELGVKGFEAYAWQGLVAPKGAPVAVLEKLNQALNASLTNEFTAQKFAALGIQPMPMSSQQFEAFAASEARLWGDVIRKANIKVD